MSQNLKNHARFVPLYHFVLASLVLVFLLFSIYRLIRNPGVGTTMGLILAVSLILLFYYARVFALAVQDRLIRLEMRLRLREVLPPELQARVAEISPDHLIGLRFAGDAELAELTSRVLDGSLTGRMEIKRAVRNWQADDCRC